MLLANDLIERTGPKPCGERTFRRKPVGRCSGEEILGRQDSFGIGRRPNSSMASGAMLEGAPVIRSVPDCVFGKAITSLMLSSPRKIATSRSMPNAKPACGGAP